MGAKITIRRRWFRSPLLLTLGTCAILISGCSAVAIEPSPETLKNGTPQEQELLACLQQKGWEVEIGRGGGVTAEYPEQQSDQYDAAQADCGAGAVPAEALVVTDEMLIDGYALQVETLECLRAEGYEALSDPPTQQTYIDSQGSWLPYGDLPEMSEDEWIGIQESCPQPNVSPDDY